MPAPRTVPLFDPDAHPASWSERMSPGEYAVHPSAFTTTGPTCTILASLNDAESYAKKQVALNPTFRCRIYDHNGFVGAPISEIRGATYRPESDISPRFRRWAGSILFFGGTLLTLIDWSADFRFGWPAMLGTRLLIPGLVLLFIEAMVMLHARHEATSRKRRPA